MEIEENFQPQITFGIVTALPKEFAAMKAMLISPSDFQTPRGRSYCLGQIPAKGGGTHWIALKLGDQGTAAATYHATLLLEDFPEADAILMVGIAGGIPDISKPNRHVRLGDIVVSGERGVIAYDFVKEHATWTEPRHPPRTPHPGLLQACRRLDARALGGDYLWLEHLKLSAGLPNSIRPVTDTDKLADTNDSGIFVTHPNDTERRPDQPRVFLGAIASSNTLLKNPVHRDALRDTHDVRAVEMEASGVAEASWNQQIGWLVVRGICDYCDSHKGDDWQGYAACVAAAYARAILEEIPLCSPKSTITRELKNRAPSEEALRALAQKLLFSGTPPSIPRLFGKTSPSAKLALEKLAATLRTIQSSNKVSAIGNLVQEQDLHHIVIGPPGSGKTHALWQASSGFLASGPLIPLYIQIGIAATWAEIMQQLSAAGDSLDIAATLRDPRVCVVLDGWSEFSADSERAHAMNLLHGSRVIANGRRGFSDPRFKTWEIDPLPSAVVQDAITTAFPERPAIDPMLEEILQIPLGLSLYILLGGSATTRGELLSSFHAHLSRGFPAEFRRVLAGAVASSELEQRGRSWSRFTNELQTQALEVKLEHAEDLLQRLGTLELRESHVVPIHDLYWSWLSGVGLLGGNRITSSLRLLKTRQDVTLALESGLRPDGRMVTSVQDSDVLLASELAARLGSDEAAVGSLQNKVAVMLEDSRLPVRCRGMLAAFRAHDGRILSRALAVLTEMRGAKIYSASVNDALDMDFLYAHRGELSSWIGSMGTDQILESIARRGDSRWGAWLEQLMNSGKLTAEEASSVALSCCPGIPTWVNPHLSALIKTAAHKLRRSERSNPELARWIVDHYDQMNMRTSGWFHLNKFLLASKDEALISTLLSKFDSLPEQAQEILGYLFADTGDPWLGRLQKKALAAGAKQHMHAILDIVSGEIDDATARQWVNSGPKLLGWRVLIARHGNAIVPELLANLPVSFDELHEIPALKAMEYLDNPPDSLADELWKRVGKVLSPMVGQDLLLALAPIRQRGIPSIVATLSRNPMFLPEYHFMLLLQLLKKWQEKMGVSLRVRSAGGDQSFAEWIVLSRLHTDHSQWTRDSGGLRSVRNLVLPAFLDELERGNLGVLDLIVASGPVDGFHRNLVEHLLADSAQAAKIPKLFENALGAFPEDILVRLLALTTVNFHEFVRTLAMTSNPAHPKLHLAILKRGLAETYDMGLYRRISQILRVHPRAVIQDMLREMAATQTVNGLWLIREIEAASGELLIDESGRWLDKRPPQWLVKIQSELLHLCDWWKDLMG